MIRSKTLLPLMFILALFNACNEQVGTPILTLDLERMNDNVPSLTDVNVVRLDNGKESMLGGPVLVLDELDHRFVLHDVILQRSMYVFDQQGRFVNKSKSGRGPGEMVFPFGMSMDQGSNQILIWDQSARTMNWFTPDLEFLHTKEFRNSIIKAFVTRGDGTFLTYTQSRDLDEENGSSSSYCLRNAEGEILKKYFPFENENLGQWGLFSPFWKEEDQIYLVCPLNFTIFRFEDGEMEPWMQVDFGAASADFGKIKEEGEIDFDDLREGGTKVLKMDYLIHTGEYLAFSFFVDGETKFVIFDKDRETLYYSDVLYENGVLPKCQLQAFRNGRFLALVEPLDLIEFSKSYPHSGFEMKKPSESDNPYVLTFALAN